ncbi:hypothetical protein Tco_0475071 [Tanacetum coccineum]
MKQREEQRSKGHKLNDDNSFNTRGSREDNFNLNTTAGDKEDEVEDVRPSCSIGKDRAKRKGIAGTSSTSSTTGFDAKSLAKLMVNDSSCVSADYVPAGHVLISADRYRIC